MKVSQHKDLVPVRANAGHPRHHGALKALKYKGPIIAPEDGQTLQICQAIEMDTFGFPFIHKAAGMFYWHQVRHLPRSLRPMLYAALK